MKELDRLQGCLLGLATGDAVGTTVEFQPRGSFDPMTDMIGGGPFGLKPGEWTDDTSMALCLAASLIERQSFDPKDQMDRYVRWWKEGYLSSTGRCFDIGNTVRRALSDYQQYGDPFAGSTDPYSAGNGSIMRLAPVPMFFYPDIQKAVHYSGESSRTTHGARACIDACRYLALLIYRALGGADKQKVLADWDGKGDLTPQIQEIASGTYQEKTEDEIRGSGYVIESLEAALWCFYQTNSFEEAVLKAVNLGGDADTTGAICGQVAGAYYGRNGIPEGWLEPLCMRDEINEFADHLFSFRGGIYQNGKE